MKKIKIMLVGIAVLAIVGGGLAFKARNAFITNLWTSTTIIPSNGCVILTFSTIGGFGGPEVYYTIVNPFINSGMCIARPTALTGGDL
jgi:hypothetical protein